MDQSHHILSGFKALFTEGSIAIIEEARRACGGAGYQSNAGFANLLSQMSPTPTLEGENKMMLGQAARYLVKIFTLV